MHITIYYNSDNKKLLKDVINGKEIIPKEDFYAAPKKFGKKKATGN